MTLLVFAAIFAALGIVLIVLPFHVATTGACLLALALVLFLLYKLRGKAKWKALRAALIGLTAAAMAVIFGCMIYIDLDGRDDAPQNAPEFVVVLGAQIHGDKPSRTLRERLDLAYDYLTENPEAVVVVSGGQGSDEQYTESYVMQKYLVEKGIAERRIATEDAARNTRENLMFSQALAQRMGADTDTALIITSEFHLCRAKFIARSVGLDAYGLGSTTTPWALKICYELREVFAFVKAFLQAG